MQGTKVMPLWQCVHFCGVKTAIVVCLLFFEKAMRWRAGKLLKSFMNGTILEIIIPFWSRIYLIWFPYLMFDVFIFDIGNIISIFDIEYILPIFDSGIQYYWIHHFHVWYWIYYFHIWYWIHTWYLSFFLHGHYFWLKFSPHNSA